MKKRIILAVIFLIIGAAACQQTDSPPPPSLTPVPMPTETAPLPLNDRLYLEHGISELRQHYHTLQVIWGGIAEGESMSCGIEVNTPLPPESFAAEQPIAQDLRIAAIELYETLQLWLAECDLTRNTIPPALIQQANDKLRQADRALTAAEMALSQ